MSSPARLVSLCVLWSFAISCPGAQERLLPGVEAEEGVYTLEPANNGAGPTWCFNATCIVRIGNDVFVSGLETLKDVQPLNNVRWLLFKRGEKGWELQQADEKGRTREPCPLVGYPDGRLFLSVNPTLTDLTAKNGPANPQVLQFAAANPRAPFTVLQPAWEGTPAFTEHSYRGLCADGPNRELLLFNILGHEAHHWSFLDKDGTWAKCGKCPFVMGTEYEKPEPIRTTYPAVALSRRAAHFVARGGINEPVKAWREFKFEISGGSSWNYDCRRLFYSWTPDITQTPFCPPIEIASREKTAGYIQPWDMWLDKEGRAHILWIEKSVWDPRLRDKFFPDVKITTGIEYCVVDKGQVVQRATLVAGGEGMSAEIPSFAHFHATPDGRLLVLYYVNGADAKGRPVSENRIMEIFPGGGHGDSVKVPLQYPFNNFMTASERGGSAPSYTLDVLGTVAERPGISYARINLANRVLADFDATVQQTPSGSRVSLDGTRAQTVAGKIAAWDWSVDGTAAGGVAVTRDFDHGGDARVTLTVKDDQGNAGTTTRIVHLPLAPVDLGLKQWGLVARTEAEAFTAEGGGTIHVRADKLGAAALSLSHWNSKGHWLAWNAEIPREDEYFLVLRYATPENATRLLTIDGQAQPSVRVMSSGGYGSDVVDNWRVGVLRDADDKPLAVHLSAGTHEIRLENGDGTGLNLDYMDWIAKHTGAVSQAELNGMATTPGMVLDENGCGVVIPLNGTVNPGQLRSDGGFCYTVSLGPRYPGFGVGNAPPSPMRLYEDGKELGPANTAHVDIRSSGQGRFSHWCSTLYFSSSDNSDPRSNGRKYTWRLPPP